MEATGQCAFGSSITSSVRHTPSCSHYPWAFRNSIWPYYKCPSLSGKPQSPFSVPGLTRDWEPSSWAWTSRLEHWASLGILGIRSLCLWGFPGGPVVKTLCFQRREHGFDPWGLFFRYAAAAAKSLQSCPTLCDPRDGSPPGSPVPGILQARTLE